MHKSNLTQRDIDSIIVLPERKGKKIFIMFLCIILSSLITGLLVYGWQVQESQLTTADYQTKIADLNDKQKMLEKQTQTLESQLGAVKLLAKSGEQADIVSKVASLTTTPPEVPTITTITDIKKFLGQELYIYAQNGDKVLFFSKSGKTVIYRPLDNTIIAQSA